MAELVEPTISQASNSISLPSRADVVQRLYVLLSIIEWVKPSEGVYNICQHVRPSLKSVLESMLGPRDRLSATIPSTEDMGFFSGFDAFEEDGRDYRLHDHSNPA